MSFYMTFSFYRPGVPPRPTGPGLAAFVSAFASLGVADENGRIDYGVRFGRAVDQDEAPATWDEPISPDGLISVTRSIDFDTGGSAASLAGLAGELARLDGTVYRAHLSLGYVADDVFSRMRRGPSENNDYSLELDSWSMEVGPVQSYSLESEARYVVGWVAVNMHGYGYLHPWTFRDLIDRAESIPAVGELMGLCCRTWPIPPGLLPSGVMKVREAMGDLWPYPVDLPWDWY